MLLSSVLFPLVLAVPIQTSLEFMRELPMIYSLSMKTSKEPNVLLQMQKDPLEERLMPLILMNFD